MKKNINKYHEFLIESIKDKIGEYGWEEITSTDYWTNELTTEKFTEEELNFLDKFAKDLGLQKPTIWNFGCSWNAKKEKEFKITIMKFEEEWFIVSYHNEEPFLYRPEEWFIVDQNGIRQQDYGLKHLLNYIVTQVI